VLFFVVVRYAGPVLLHAKIALIELLLQKFENKNMVMIEIFTKICCILIGFGLSLKKEF
jgi:hypothetical protein